MGLEAGEMGVVGRGHVIKRPRLTRMLDDTDARIILLAAPAGYGKTTLAREWLAARPHAWYRGSVASADVAALAIGLAKAASRIVPKAGERLRSRLRLSQAPLPEVLELVELLADDLSEWPSDAWLVFDDYQFACDSDSAEFFVEELASNCPLQLLVASRTRPRWATTRRTLYGEILELGRAQLGLNQDEAQAVLTEHPEDRSGGLFSLADGWPALIGLAASAASPEMPGGAFPEELYDFFAEELYQAASSDLQQGLRRIALAPYVTRDIAETVLGDRAEAVIRDGFELGFFVTGRDTLELHPLLRSFLSSKFTKRCDDPTGSLLHRLATVLTERKEWDHVFELASHFGDDAALTHLFESSLPDMLDEARLATLARWIETARSRQLDAPIVDLADAELAFRRDELGLAEALAWQAAQRLPHESPFASRALWIAGTSAHVTVNDNAALEYFDAAEQRALNDEDLSSALWGRFLVAEALERDRAARELLDELAERSNNSADDVLRIATGRYLLASLYGDTEGILRNNRHVVHLAARFRSPLIGSAFSNAHAGLLNLAGRYAEALEAAETESSIAREYALRFVLPFAHLHGATAKWGLRQFRAAGTLLTQCERASSKDSLITWAAAVRGRIALALGRPDEALQMLERVDQAADASPSLQGEHAAYKALASAIHGSSRDASILADRAESLSKRIEISALVAWARAISPARGKSHRTLAASAFDVTLATGNIDAFVAAYRAHPPALELLAGDDKTHEALKLILTRACDHALAERVGLRLSSPSRSQRMSILTRREREVLDLVSQGLLNKEIARVLFITEATVKVHVRKICQKLGVRSRTEAAVRAAELSD